MEKWIALGLLVAGLVTIPAALRFHTFADGRFIVAIILVLLGLLCIAIGLGDLVLMTFKML